MIPAPELIDEVLRLSRASDVVVIVHDDYEASLRWAGNSMTTNAMGFARSWSVVSYQRGGDGVRVGALTSTSIEAADIESVVRASEHAASQARPASDAMDLVGGQSVSPQWSDAAATTAIDVFAPIVGDLAYAFAGEDLLYGFAHHQVRTTWLASSTGLRLRCTEPIGSVEINGKRDLASAWVGAGTQNFADVDVAAMCAELETRLSWGQRRVDLPAGRYDTILPPSAVADMLIYLVWTMEGRGAEEGHTALAAPGGGTRVGERLTTLPLTLSSDPQLPGLEYAPFVAATASSEAVSVFDNGMPADRVEWLRNGTVSALSYSRSAAAEFGATAAVPGNNLILTGGSAATTAELVANTERGLLLTTLWYIRMVDPTSLLLTGLTRDGVYLIEDGRITGEVNNFRFNESPLDLLRRATEVGATVPALPREWKDWFSRTAMPPMRIPDFHMSSVSQAR